MGFIIVSVVYLALLGVGVMLVRRPARAEALESGALKAGASGFMLLTLKAERERARHREEFEGVKKLRRGGMRPGA